MTSDNIKVVLDNMYEKLKTDIDENNSKIIIERHLDKIYNQIRSQKYQMMSLIFIQSVFFTGMLKYLKK